MSDASKETLGTATGGSDVNGHWLPCRRAPGRYNLTCCASADLRDLLPILPNELAKQECLDDIQSTMTLLLAFLSGQLL